MTQIARLAPADCIADEMARVQCSLTLLIEFYKYPGPEPEAYLEQGIFKIATRSLEISEGLDADEAEAELERRVRNSKRRIHALLNQCEFSAIRHLDKVLQQKILEATE